jgi:ATP-dependent Zn protease
MVLLSGRVAEEIMYGESITTGAMNDFDEALKLAGKMVLVYGMGSNIIYSSLSDYSKKTIDEEVTNLINNAYFASKIILEKYKDKLRKTSAILNEKRIIKAPELKELLELDGEL